MLWMDVDLYHSASSVLNHVYPQLARGAVIFSDEISWNWITAGYELRPGIRSVGLAIREFFEKSNLPYSAQHLMEYLGIIIPRAGGQPLISQSRFIRLKRLVLKRTANLHSKLTRLERKEVFRNNLLKLPHPIGTLLSRTHYLLKRFRKSFNTLLATKNFVKY